MLPSGSSGDNAAGAWADDYGCVFLLFGCRRRKGVAVRGHSNANICPKPMTTTASRDGEGGYILDLAKPSTQQQSQVGAGAGAGAGAAPMISDEFCCTGHFWPKNMASPVAAAAAAAFGAKDHYKYNSRSSSSSVGGSPEFHFDATSVFFCVGYPNKGKSTHNDGVLPDGGAGGGGGKSTLERKRSASNGVISRSRSTARLSQQQEKQQQSLHQETKPFRRKSSGSGQQFAPPVMSGRVAVVPRRSVDSAAKPAPPPPTGSPMWRLSSSSSFGSFLSLASDEDGRGGTRRETMNSARRSSTNLRRRRTVILDADMPEQLQQDAKECTVRAINRSSDHEDMAALIKQDFDQMHGAKWHCIVGRHFGSFVTAEKSHFVHLHVGKVAVLLFKAGAP
ncbi:unnamed protein product [Pylaiella littoralis]